jgi:ankyrin repeat protein
LPDIFFQLETADAEHTMKGDSMSARKPQSHLSAPADMPTRKLPDKPDLRHLKDQARDLLSSGQAPSLTRAQFLIARSYGFPSWPKLKTHVDSLHEIGRLKAAIDTNDLATVTAMMTDNPALHRAPLGYGNNGPLTWVAECRVPRIPPAPERLKMARWMIENGSDVHQGGDGPLMRAALSDMRIPMMELLVEYGADVNALWDGRYPIILAPCETLAPAALRWLVEHGADPQARSAQYGGALAMVIGTYSRDSAGKHACLDALTSLDFELPDTPPMALHSGRMDLLEEHMRRDPSVISQRFAYADIFPPEMETGDWGLTSTPLDRTTLLHMAVEFDDSDAVKWLIDHGADPNARSEPDSDGFGDHTPLFHTVVTMGRKDDEVARLLLRAGADPNVRGTLRKQLRHMGDEEQEKLREFHGVTPMEYARAYQVPYWINESAVAALSAVGR